MLTSSDPPSAGDNSGKEKVEKNSELDWGWLSWGQLSNVVESGSWCSSSKLIRGVIVNAGVLCNSSFCSTELSIWTVLRGVRNDLGSRLSSEELGRSSESREMEDSNNGDSGLRLEYPRFELGSRDNITVSSFVSVWLISKWYELKLSHLALHLSTYIVYLVVRRPPLNCMLIINVFY